MLYTFTQKIRKAFSDAADRYDILTSLHKEIGRELVKKYMRLSAASILDVGCGTGYVANKARFFFPEAQIVGLDIAYGMTAKAKEMHEGIPISWVQGDAGHMPFRDGAFDLIFSNLAYQWVHPLAEGFKQARRVLSPNGSLCLTMFGQGTCRELFESITSCKPHHRLSLLPSVQEAEQALVQAGFVQVSVDYELIKVEFKDVMELIGWLKAIGANHLGEAPVFLGKQALHSINEYYRTHYPYNDGICASFEVIWAYAKT